MYYLKSRFYDPEIARFLCADGVFTTEISAETLHNRNIYGYCNNNPISREDSKGTFWIATAVSFVAGSLVSIGTQMILEKKAWNEINWLEVGLAGTSTALAFLGVPTWVQNTVSIVGEIGNSIYEGKNLAETTDNVVISAIGCILPAFKTDGYLNCTREYHKSVKKVIDKNLNSLELTVDFANVTKTYQRSMKDITKKEIINQGASTGYSGVTTKIQDAAKNRIRGWGHYYDPKKRMYRRYPIR